MRRTLIVAAASAAIGAFLVAPFAFQKGRGPAVRLINVTPLGPGHAGGVLPLVVDGRLRDGCIPIVARSITRIILNHHGELQLIKEPLTNVPLVAHDPVPPADMIKRYGFDARKIVPLFLPLGIPDVSQYGAPFVWPREHVDETGVTRAAGYVEPWKLSTDTSPMACGLGEAMASLWNGDVVGAHDIPIEILPPVLASEDKPPPAADQTGTKGTSR